MASLRTMTSKGGRRCCFRFRGVSSWSLPPGRGGKFVLSGAKWPPRREAYSRLFLPTCGAIAGSSSGRLADHDTKSLPGHPLRIAGGSLRGCSFFSLPSRYTPDGAPSYDVRLELGGSAQAGSRTGAGLGDQRGVFAGRGLPKPTSFLCGSDQDGGGRLGAPYKPTFGAPVSGVAARVCSMGAASGRRRQGCTRAGVVRGRADAVDSPVATGVRTAVAGV